jgi:hypothetical protein
MLHDFAARMLTNDNRNLFAGIGVLLVVFTGFASPMKARPAWLRSAWT